MAKTADNTTVVPAGEHSPLGPSSSKRWINCPGSVAASVGATDDESVYAAEGTAAHYLSELCRRGNLPAIDWLGHIFVVGKYKFTVDEEMADSVQSFVDWVQEQPGTPLIEQRVGYSDSFRESTIERFGPAFGTLDDARLVDSDCYITDFKHGKGVQEWAKENTQLLCQALGVYKDFGYLYEISGFWLQISQPRLNHFDSWYISVPKLLEWEGRLQGYGAAIEQATQFKAGDWCKFCRIRKKCAVRANSSIQLVIGDAMEEGDFEDLDAEHMQVTAMRAQNGLQHITDERLAEILPSLDIIKACLKDLEKRAVEALMAGKELGGWKLVAGRAGSRKFIDDKIAAEKLQSLDVDPYEPRKLISVAVAEKALGKAEFGRRFKLTEDFTKPDGKPKLAPPSDKRPALTSMTEADFEDLDD